MSLLLSGGPAEDLLRGSACVEGIHPAETGEAGEVGVARIELGAVLDGECGEVGIGHQIAGGPHRPEQLTNEGQVSVTGVNDHGAWVSHSALHHVECLVH